MKALKASALMVAAAAIVGTTACSQKVLDYRNATIDNGKIYSGDENKAFSGRLTNVPELQLLQSQEGIAQFLRPVARSNADLNHYGDRAGVTALLAASQAACDVDVADGYLDGKATCAGADSTPGTEMTFSAGTITGDLRYYNLSYAKTLVSEGSFEDGKPEGKQEIFAFDTGKLLMTVQWKNDGMNGPVEKFDPTTGKRVYTATYVDGVLDGDLKEFSPDGNRVTHTATYKNGKLEGLEDRYDADTGTHLAHLTWVDGYLHGRVQRWDATGRATVDTEYRYGHPAAWDETPEVKEPTEQPAVSSSSAADAQSAPGCVERWTSAYRNSAGSDAPVSPDQLDEWKEWCANGRLPEPPSRR